MLWPRDSDWNTLCHGQHVLEVRDTCACPPRRLVRQKSSVKFPTKSVQVTAAVIKGKIRMWEYVEGMWNGDAAASMYTKLSSAMKRSHGTKRSYVVLEDNDPAGYKSGKGKPAKLDTNIVTHRIISHTHSAHGVHQSMAVTVGYCSRTIRHNHLLWVLRACVGAI